MMDVTAEAIKKNIQEVESRISLAAERVGREPDEVQIVAVTKGRPAEVVRIAHECGLSWYGENRVRQGLEKMDALADLADVQWDMIGHIQSRKAKLVVPKYHWVHSVDRMKIAEYLNRFAEGVGRQLPVLLECNVSGEEAKYGFDLARQEEWPSWLEQAHTIAEMPALQVQGLMTMAPWQSEQSVIRATFRKLFRLRQYLQEKLPEKEWFHLSMGMTDDYEVAVEEGATILRLGRALFGDRS